VYLNLEESEYDQYIYRIISYERFIDLFKNRKNTLIKPKLWEDNFENLVLKSKLKFPDGSEIELDTHERLYGQCWTTSKASDAMWRIYSQDKQGIRIRTTIKNLLYSLDLANVNTAMTESCIGKVGYKAEATIISQAKQAFSPDGRITFGSLFSSLLIKRKAFDHEKEVRLIYLDWGYKLPIEDIYSYEIDPHELITQVMIDPRISYDEFKKIKKDIIHKTGYQGDIKRSLLYRLPDNLTIEMDQNIQSNQAGRSD